MKQTSLTFDPVPDFDARYQEISRIHAEKLQVPTSQKEAIRMTLERFGSITSLEAFNDFGITRLAARIYDLRKDGLSITAEAVSAFNRFGHPMTYFRYRIAHIERNEAETIEGGNSLKN